MAKKVLGINKYWHKRIVRAGINTLCLYKEDPKNRIIEDDDTIFLDFSPLFEQWEADFGRTYVLGNDPEKDFGAFYEQMLI